jgi:hypothetical protein
MNHETDLKIDGAMWEDILALNEQYSDSDNEEYEYTESDIASNTSFTDEKLLDIDVLETESYSGMNIRCVGFNASFRIARNPR